MKCHTGLETTAVDSGQRQSQLCSCWRRCYQYWSDTLGIPKRWPSSDPFPSNMSHPTWWSNTLLSRVSLPSTDTRVLLDWNCVKVQIKLRKVHLWAQPLPAGPLELCHCYWDFFWPWLTLYVVCWLFSLSFGFSSLSPLTQQLDLSSTVLYCPTLSTHIPLLGLSLPGGHRLAP